MATLPLSYWVSGIDQVMFGYMVSISCSNFCMSSLDWKCITIPPLVVCKESQPLYLETKVFFSYFWYNLLFGYLVEDFLVCSQLSWYKTFCETLWMFISVLWVVFWKHWSYINNFILEFYIDKNFWWFKLWKFIYS